MNVKVYIYSTLLLATFVFSGIRPVRCEDAAPDAAREEEEAKEEDKKAAENDSNQESAVKGKVALMPLEDGGAIPTVAGILQGTLTHSGEKSQTISVLLKLKDPKAQRELLAKLGNKEIQLRGYFRNARKYLIVTDIDIDPAVPPAPQEGL
jgi:hypothetical protein